MTATGKLDGKNFKELCEALLSLESAEECKKFLNDLCTPAEIAALADRWRVAKMVDRGIPYRKIYEKTGVSTATITRVGRCLTTGAGGYRLVLEKLERTDA